MSRVLKPNLGTAISTSSAGFGAFEASMHGVQEHFDGGELTYARDKDGLMKLDSENNPIQVLNEEGQVYRTILAGLKGMATGTMLALGWCWYRNTSIF